jgi:cobalt/nickel transport system permease protein
MGRLTRPDEWRQAGITAGSMLTRSLRMGDDVHMAMQSRGFDGDIRLLEESRMRSKDWVALAALILIAAAAIVAGR